MRENFCEDIRQVGGNERPVHIAIVNTSSTQINGQSYVSSLKFVMWSI